MSDVTKAILVCCNEIAGCSERVAKRAGNIFDRGFDADADVKAACDRGRMVDGGSKRFRYVLNVYKVTSLKAVFKNREVLASTDAR